MPEKLLRARLRARAHARTRTRARAREAKGEALRSSSEAVLAFLHDIKSPVPPGRRME